MSFCHTLLKGGTKGELAAVTLSAGILNLPLVDALLEEKLGDKSWLVVRYLDRPGPRRNTMPVMNTAMASLRCRYDIVYSLSAFYPSGVECLPLQLQTLQLAS